MNREPVLTAGGIAGLLLAGWQVLVAQGLTEALRPEARDSLNAFAALLVPVVAALVARQLVTPVDSPQLAEGTPVTLPGGDAGRVVLDASTDPTDGA
jgi:hypothetical protein